MAWDASKPNAAEAKSLFPAQAQGNWAALEDWLNDVGNFPTTPGLLGSSVSPGTLPKIHTKLANQTINNSDTLTNDTHLVYAAAANHVHLVEVFLILFAANTTADWKFGWAVPAGSTLLWAPNAIYANTGVFSTVFGSWAGSETNTTGPSLLDDNDVLSIGSANLFQGLQLTGIFTTVGTAGSLQFKWAQNTANASDSIISVGSMMRVTVTV